MYRRIFELSVLRLKYTWKAKAYEKNKQDIEHAGYKQQQQQQQQQQQYIENWRTRNLEKTTFLARILDCFMHAQLGRNTGCPLWFCP